MRDFHPITVIREVHANGWCARLDLSGQVLSLEVPEVDFVQDVERGICLLPTAPEAGGTAVSAGALLLKAKQFDDGLYAAVDLAAQTGAWSFVGKAHLLRSLAAALVTDFADADDAAATILAACELGGVSRQTGCGSSTSVYRTSAAPRLTLWVYPLTTMVEPI